MGVLTQRECLDRLRSTRVGRIAFLSDGFPIILPVNHGMDENTVVFRSAHGTKLDAAELELPVAFEVDGFDADRRAGWSVVVRGIANLVTDAEAAKRLDALGVWPWADGVCREQWVQISTHDMSGRQIVHHYHH